MWTCGAYAKISALKYIPAINYGRDLEQHASNAFFKIFKCSHKKPRLSNCVSFLDGEQSFIGIIIKMEL